MYNTEYEDLKNLDTRLRACGYWRDELGSHGPLPGWFFHLLGVILLLTEDDPIEYLTSDVEEGRGSILAATSDLLVFVQFTRDLAASKDRRAEIEEAVVLPRRAIRAMSLIEFLQTDNPHVLNPERATFRLEIEGRAGIVIPIGKDDAEPIREFAKSVRSGLRKR